jgi:spore maturation protein CgeB
MAQAYKVLITSASADEENNNKPLREYLKAGFAEVLSEKNVLACCLDQADIQASNFKPHLIVVFGSCAPSSSNYNSLRIYCTKKDAALVFWLHDDPYEFDFNSKIYNYADYIFSNDKWAVEHFSHKNVHHLPLAADPNIHYRPIKKKSFIRDVFFCGVAFPNRTQLLKDCEHYFRRFNVNIFGQGWPENRSMYKNIRLLNKDLPDYYSNSLVTLNIGRQFSIANNEFLLDPTSPGPRTFEAAMSGAVQIFFLNGLEIADYFNLGREILVFDTPKELAAIIEDLKFNNRYRNSIAKNSQLRALKDHTYSCRAQKILDKVLQ